MSWKIGLLAGVFAASVVGCQDAPQVKKDDPDAGPQAPVADRHIAEAVASVASTSDPMSPGAENGPPPNGIFAPGVADKRQPANAPVKATIISSGSDPKTKYLPLTSFVGTQRFDVTTVFVEGRSPKAVMFELEAKIPQAGAEEGEGKDKAAGDEAAGGGKAAPKVEPITKKTPIQFTVAGVRAHQELPLTEDDLKAYNTFKGTRISAVIEPNGGLSGETFELSKKADKERVSAVRALVDTVSLFFSPWPETPVGLGAYWIVADRATMGGLDLVRYRVTKIEQQKGDELVLSLDLRLYAAGPHVVPPGSPEGSVALKFTGQGKGAMSRKKGSPFPIEGQLQAPIALQYAAAADAQLGQVYQMQYAAGWAPFKPPAKDDEKKQP